MNNPSDIENQQEEQLLSPSPFYSSLMNTMKKFNRFIIFLFGLLVLLLNYLYISIEFTPLTVNERYYVTCSPVVLSFYILGCLSYMMFSFLCLYFFYQHLKQLSESQSSSTSRSQWQWKLMIVAGLLHVISMLLTIILFNYLCYDGEKSGTYNLLFSFMFQPLILGLNYLCLRKRNQDHSSQVTI